MLTENLIAEHVVNVFNVGITINLTIWLLQKTADRIFDSANISAGEEKRVQSAKLYRNKLFLRAGTYVTTFCYHKEC